MIEAIHVNNLNHNEFRKCDDLISKIIRTYDRHDNAFHIGGASVKFGSSNVRLIFGLQCGKKRLDLSSGQRPVSDFIQHVFDCVGGDDAFVDERKGDGIHTWAAMHTDNLEFGFGDVHEECSSWEGHKLDMTVRGNGAGALHGSTSGKDNERVNDSKVNESSSAIAILELENKRKDEMIALLEEEVAGLKKKLEKIANCKEVYWFLRILADCDVHVVTQAFHDVEVRRNSVGGSDVGVRVGGQVVHNVSPIRAHIGGAYMCNEAVGLNAGCELVDSDGGHYGRTSAGIVNVDLSDVDEGVIVFGVQTSFVRNIKNKVRQERKLPDFEYPILHGRNKKSVTDSCVVVRNDDCVKNDGVIDVDVVVVTGNKWSGFDINNRLGVWKMMIVEKKCKIKQGYDRHSDRVVVYFSDVKNLIRQSSIHGNVIDAYVELLKSEHLRMYGDDELANKSYFFSSDMVKNDDVRTMEKFVHTNVSVANECRFIHFPMCHDGHWTLIVYDTEDGTRKHYNLMRQRGERADVHHNVATLLKERVTNVMKQTLRDFGLDEQSILANFSSSLEAVTKCPQQKPRTLDCGVIVCAIMRQYVHRCDVERSLQGTNCIILRANMVKAFVNDPARGLKYYKHVCECDDLHDPRFFLFWFSKITVCDCDDLHDRRQRSKAQLIIDPPDMDDELTCHIKF
ncbi:hypothetical protein LOK49_LG10G02439 [Camellia lanceoleosa]|uniref:Uncharacterized protein n=1 Tax=Camellia lanceoleosa TaxID=1840588 RepID=A0ACC0GCG1_9ERIC|nr:hypothetical protein LOK49_LG10G02439 [Camellia lanceoleosa]